MIKQNYNYYLLLIVLLLLFTVSFSSCKKETTIAVTLFNPALNEYVPNATIVLNEINSSGCNQIAEAITDATGIAFFNKEKLRTNGKYKLGVKDSWGITHLNPCSSQTQNYLNIGGSENIILTDYIEAEYDIKCFNTLNPSMTGDSLTIDVFPMIYYDPVYNITQGGGGGNTVNFTYDLNYPTTPIYTTPKTKIFANRLVVKTRKRKMGTVTETVDTVRMHPYNGAITTVEINW